MIHNHTGGWAEPVYKVAPGPHFSQEVRDDWEHRRPLRTGWPFASASAWRSERRHCLQRLGARSPRISWAELPKPTKCFVPPNKALAAKRTGPEGSRFSVAERQKHIANGIVELE